MKGEDNSMDGLGWDIGILLVLAGVLGFVHNLSASGNPFGFFPLILTALGAGQLMNSGDTGWQAGGLPHMESGK